MSDVDCPYCGAAQEINHDDGYGYEEDETYEQECIGCEKNFAYSTMISFYYEVNKADCLNGEDHNYKAMATYPREYTRMECVDCGDRREPTEEEMKKFLDAKYLIRRPHEPKRF